MICFLLLIVNSLEKILRLLSITFDLNKGPQVENKKEKIFF